MGQVATSYQPRSTVSDHVATENNFSDSVARLLDRIDCRPADTTAERDAIFRLRYQAYLREGAISPNAAQTFSDPYDETENAYLFGLYIDRELASSIRIHVATREHPDFPSLAVFSDILQPELDAGKVIIDPTRFVVDEALSRLHGVLPYATARIVWLASAYFAADLTLSAVRVEHQAFYRRTFCQRVLCGPRPYPHLSKPISLMAARYSSVEEQVHRRLPFLRSTLFERRMLFERHRMQPACGQPAGATASVP
jgi:N-acyl-L-homoserine lactone synthetase